MGVLKKDENNGLNELFITQTLPESNKKIIKNLKQIGEKDSEFSQLNDTNNEIGFYVSCHLGLAFSHHNLIELILAYRNFRNSIMIVYDVNKSAFGANPIRCFRLSLAAIEALSLNNLSEITDSLLQRKISQYKLTIDNFFEEVYMKMHRSHLLQAFLFDHIQPHMPSFNVNLLKLGNTSEYMNQHLWTVNEQS